jgi:hypothetical protein
MLRIERTLILTRRTDDQTDATAIRMKSYLVDPTQEDLREKMVFLGGPRRRKVHSSLSLLADESHPAYLCWDGQRFPRPPQIAKTVPEHWLGAARLLPSRRGFPPGRLSLLPPAGRRRLARTSPTSHRALRFLSFYQVYLDAGGEDLEWPEAKARVFPFVRFCEVLKV